MVMLESGQDTEKNLYVEATLIRSDNEDEIKNSALEGTKIVRISNGTFATFKKLKIMTTSQMQGTFFRIKFYLKRYNGKEFHNEGAFTISNPIEVFSHSQYITPKKEGRYFLILFFIGQNNELLKLFFIFSLSAPPPPVVLEVLPSTGPAGCRVAILGTNFVNTAKLKVQFGPTDIVPTFHEAGTLVCTAPPNPPGPVQVRVTNDSSHYSNSNTTFTYR